MSTFLLFSQAAGRVGATAKRLEKSAILGEYFAALSDEDLLHAARYFAGTIFPLRDQRTVNIGGAALLAAIRAVISADETHLRTRAVALGDLGDVAGEAFGEMPEVVAPTLLLSDANTHFETLASTAGSKRKVEMVAETLHRASPLEAKYLVKILQGDLRIGLKEGAVEDAIARLASQTVARVQWANMLNGDIGETALLARRGELQNVRMRLLHPLKFMLATPAADLSDIARQMPESFAVEDKFDGIRAQAHIARDESALLHGVSCFAADGQSARVALFSRTLDEITPAFPDLVAPLAELLSRGELILDGEIVPVRGAAILPFQELQKRLGRKTPTSEILAQIPVAFIAYDILYSDDRVVLDEPFEIRRALLESLQLQPISDAATVRCADSKTFEDVLQLDEEFDAARLRGNEGLMIKDPRSPYKPGRRGRDWLKLKRALATLDVVVTSVEVGSGRRSKLLSDYTFAVRASETDATLLNIGKAYSGLTDAELEELSQWFRAHTLQALRMAKCASSSRKSSSK